MNSAGNAIVAGEIEGAGGGDFWIGEYRGSSGARLWQLQINGPGSARDRLYDVAVAPNDDFVVVGQVDASGGDGDIFVRRYRANRTVVWTATVSAPGQFSFDTGLAVDINATGEVLVAGQVDTSTPGWMRKWDSVGRVAWTRSSANRVRDVAFANNGDIYAAGSRGYQAGAITRREIILEKLDARGQLLWTRTERSPNNGNSEASAVAVARNGDVAVGGFIGGATLNDPNAWVRRYTSAGVARWTALAGGTARERDEIMGLAFAANDDLVAVGFLSDNVTIGNDLWFVRRYSPAGAVNWTRRYDGPRRGEDRAHGVAIAPTGNIFVVGQEEVCDRNPCTVGSRSNLQIRVESLAP